MTGEVTNKFRAYSFGISESSEFWQKADFKSLRQPETKRMRILKTAELEMKAIFIGSKLATTTFSNYSRPTGSLLTKSEISAKSSLPAFEAKGFGAFEICRFSERCPKEYVFEVCKSQKRQKNVPKEYTLKGITLFEIALFWQKTIEWFTEFKKQNAYFTLDFTAQLFCFCCRLGGMWIIESQVDVEPGWSVAEDWWWFHVSM